MCLLYVVMLFSKGILCYFLSQKDNIVTQVSYHAPAIYKKKCNQVQEATAVCIQNKNTPDMEKGRC